MRVGTITIGIGLGVVLGLAACTGKNGSKECNPMFESCGTGGSGPGGDGSGGSGPAAGGSAGAGSAAGNGGVGGKLGPGKNAGKPGGKALQLTAGMEFTCALLEGGRVRCWGANALGQLGYGHKENIGDDELPLSQGDVNLGAPAVQIAAAQSGRHTCALLEGGRLHCWGNNNKGQLGYGNTLDITDAARAPDVDVGSKVSQVAAGREHTCALLEGGKVRCWGNPESGVLGYGNKTIIGDDETPAQIGDVDIGGKAIQIAAGAHNTCAVLEDGHIRCWGDYASHGGNGVRKQQNIGDNEVPSAAPVLTINEGARSLTIGALFACAWLESGAVQCWGIDPRDTGILGNGWTSVPNQDKTIAESGPVRLSALATQLGSGDNHACAVLPGGLLSCWGEGQLGRLGYGDWNNVSNPSEQTAVRVGGAVKQVVGGYAHTCALLESGAVRCWGEGGVGQLGYGNSRDLGGKLETTPEKNGDVPL